MHPATYMCILSRIGFSMPITLQSLVVLSALLLLTFGPKFTKSPSFALGVNIIVYFSSMIVAGRTIDIDQKITGQDLPHLSSSYCWYNLAVFVIISTYICFTEGFVKCFRFVAKEIIKILVSYMFFYLIYLLNLRRDINCIILFLVILVCKFCMYRLHNIKLSLLIYLSISVIWYICEVLLKQEILGVLYVLFMLP